MNKVNDNNNLAIQMLIAMVSGILVGEHTYCNDFLRDPRSP